MAKLLKLCVLLLVFLCCETRISPDTMELVNRLLHDIGQRVNEPPKLHPSEQDLRRLNSRSYKHGDLAGLLNLLIKSSQQDYIEQRNWFTEDGAIRGTSPNVGEDTGFNTTIPASSIPSSTTTTTTTTTTATTIPTSLTDIWKLIAKLNKLFG